ncbi:ornithine cyclodeaminase family protein [Ramlibacter tataouinensis]|uniref:ornithine cyclodeaminase family protein n=1 Tax=Ramlibacter tataouinensis TaxID=94132 RepID=UPI0022F4000B|nr:ornithine cyclodeaminase family protein [Ramlibacter tataouinensis]WBY01187.1 ornithine cyclodeaminase family protein [Ramlibacter tataouinensis]
MLHITDAMVEGAIRPRDAQQVLHDAFTSFTAGRAAMQERARTEAGGVKLSTLGAVLPDLGVAGAKVYSTLAGRFSFVILLFSSENGRPLASLDAGAITRLRTAACTVLAARRLARPDARRLALFGTGVQATAHALQLAEAFPLEAIRVCSRTADPRWADDLQRACGVPVSYGDAAGVLDGADLVVTASRSPAPLFPGELLPQDCFVAATGSSLPTTRELDDRALARASQIVVEWRAQALREAGDLVLAAPELRVADRVVELGALLARQAPGRANADGIAIYKSVGVGLQDVALAGLAWQRLQARGSS